jgi:hypothetical protein
MMSTVRAGLANLRANLPILNGLYLGKLVLAGVFTLPIFIMVNGPLAQSEYARVLLSEWSVDVFSELMIARPNVLTTMIAVLFFYAAVLFVLKQFVNGGIYGSLTAKRLLAPREFFARCGEMFTGNLQISLLMAAIYFVLGVLGLFFGSMVPDGPFRQFSVVSLIPTFLRGAVLYIFVIFGGVLSDIMRLRLSTHPSKSVRDIFRGSWDTYRRHFVKLIGVYYLYFVPFVIIWMVVELVAIRVTGALAGVIGVLIELALFQLCSYLRTGQSLLATATYAHIVTPDMTEQRSKKADSSDND